jgi:hypothetical protein
MGGSAGSTGQGIQSVALGFQTAMLSQGPNCVAIGANAGETSQGGSGGQAVSVGAYLTQQTLQGTGAVSVGYDAATTSQGARAIAVGLSASPLTQGANSIAIGANAVSTSVAQAANTIVLNATNTPLVAGTASATYINPIRVVHTNDVLLHTSTNEVVKQPYKFDASGNLLMAGAEIRTAPVVGNTAGNLTLQVNATGAGGTLSISGGTDILSGSSGGNTGLHLRVFINGTPYKIRLEADV